MEVAIVAFTITYDHNAQRLMLHIDKMAMRKRAVETNPSLVRQKLAIHARLLPPSLRARSSSRKMSGVYFFYNQVIELAPARAADIGGMWLRLRLYRRIAPKWRRRIAEGHMGLTEVPLTYKMVPFTLTMTDELDLSFVPTPTLVREPASCKMDGLNNMKSVMCLTSAPPRLAMQLNYNKTLHRFIVHLQRAENIDRYGRFVAFEVMLTLPNRPKGKQRSKEKVVQRVRSEAMETAAITLVHVAFELQASPSDCKICRIVVLVYSGHEKRHTLNGKRPHCPHLEGSVTLGPQVDEGPERNQYFEAFVDANPTDLAWFQVQEGRRKRFYVNEAISS